MELSPGRHGRAKTEIDVTEYHRAKTGALFVGAVSAGAIAAGQDPAQWRPLGTYIGQAYQLADDLLDAVGGSEECGKPVAQDTANARPNAVLQFGLQATIRRLKDTVELAASSVPDCDGADGLRGLIVAQATRLVPAELAKQAA